MFDTTTHPAAQPLLGTHPPRALARRMHATWIHFARHVHPDWPDYNLASRPVMSFKHPTCQLINDRRGNERVLWDSVT